jgi:hypothetical protein
MLEPEKKQILQTILIKPEGSSFYNSLFSTVQSVVSESTAENDILRRAASR